MFLQLVPITDHEPLPSTNETRTSACAGSSTHASFSEMPVAGHSAAYFLTKPRCLSFPPSRATRMLLFLGHWPALSSAARVCPGGLSYHEKHHCCSFGTAWSSVSSAMAVTPFCPCVMLLGNTVFGEARAISPSTGRCQGAGIVHVKMFFIVV